MRWPRVALVACAAAFAFAFLFVPVSSAHASVHGPGARSARSASLTVVITSLPRSRPGNVIVKGPGRFFRYVGRSITVRHLVPGAYVVHAGPVRVRSGLLYPVTADVRLQLPPGSNRTVKVRYADTIPSTTKVVAAASVTGISGSADGPATLTLSSLPSGLAVGDIIVVGLTQSTPYGFLGKVTALSGSGTHFSVSTVPATLEQAVPSGVIDPSWTEPSQTEPVDDSGISCGTGASLSVTGNLGLTPGGDFAAQWAGGAVTSASFDGTLTLTQQLKAAVDAAASCTVDHHPLLAAPKVFLPPIPVPLGRITIYLVPVLQFYLSADASTNASLTEDATMTATATAGLDFANGQLTPVSKFTTAFTPQAPTPDLQGHLSASVGPTLSLLIEGVAGPEVNLDGSLALDVTPLDSPAWTFTGGLAAGGGLTIPILGLDESNPSIISHSVLLDSSPPVIQTTSLPAGTVGTAYNQTLTASSGTPPYQWSVSAGSLPPGLSLDPTTGAISGTPTQSGSFSFTAKVADSSDSVLNPAGQTATHDESITISGAGGGGGGGGGGTTATTAPLPSDAASNPNMVITSVACPSASQCIAIGQYANSSGNRSNVALAGSGSSWMATELPLPSDADSAGTSSLDALACASTTSCNAVGWYLDSSNQVKGLALTWSGQAWQATGWALPSNANLGDNPDLGSISCPSANCTAVGTYTDVSNQYSDAVIVTGSGSSWTAAQAPAPSNAGASSDTDLQDIACASATSCTAVGGYTDSAGDSQGQLLSGSGSSWTATEAPLPPNAAPVTVGTALNSIVCPSTSSCVAAGEYRDTAGNQEALLVTGSGSSWTPAGTALPTGAAVFGAQLNAISCATSSACVAVGNYSDTSSNLHPLLVTGSASSWTATNAPLPPDAITTNSGPTVAAVQCPSATGCLAVGQYQVSGQRARGLLLTGSGPSWTPAGPPLPANALTAGDDALDALACPTTSACVAVGYYIDSGFNTQGLLVTGSS